jgi:arsenite-transporting ATPase
VRLVLYTGKGGVGKTTTAAATAACAAARGRRTLVASADAAHSLGDVLERRLGPEPAAVGPRLDALEVDARAEMARHWGRIRDWLVALLRYQGIEEVVAEELALLPGAEELTTLLAVETHARSGRYDLVVVDCAPTDSTLRLLTLPDVVRSSLRALLRLQQAVATLATPLARLLVAAPLPGPEVFADADRLLYRRLRGLRRLLAAPAASIRLVVTPERMVIDEARRAFTDLALFQLPVDAVVMNRLLPGSAVREAFFRDWGLLQEERRREVEALFAPLPVLPAPLQEDEVTGLERLRAHGELLFERHPPDSLLCQMAGLRFVREEAGWRVELPLPGAERADLDVAKREDELLVRAGARRQAIRLPRRLAAAELGRARLAEGVLAVWLHEASGARAAKAGA